MASFDGLIQRGLDAHRLAGKYSARVVVRLPQGHVEWLAAQIQALGGAVPAQRAEKVGARVASTAQSQAAALLLGRITAMRASARMNPLATALDRKGLGAGAKLSASAPKGLISAATAIIAFAGKSPARMQALGFLPEDFARLEGLMRATQGADASEDQARAGSKESTKARNAAAKNVEDGVRRIAAAGLAAFAEDAAVRAEFEALVAPKAGKSGPNEAAAAAPK